MPVKVVAKRRKTNGCCVANKTQQQRKNYLVDSKKALNISLLGVNKVLNSQVSNFKKIVWIFVLCVCSVICLFQLYNRISFYFQKPVVVAFTMEKVSTLEFPAMIFCPALHFMYNNSQFEIAARKYCEQNECSNLNYEEAVQTIPFTDLGLNLESMWADHNISLSDIHLDDQSCSFGHCESSFNTTKTRTALGDCVSVIKDENMMYRGVDTLVSVTLKNRNYHTRYLERYFASWVYFYRKGFQSMASFISDSEGMIKDRINVVRLTMQKFIYLNRPGHPCEDKKLVTKCINECMMGHLQRFLRCRLPFMNSAKLEDCHNWNESVESAEAALHLLSTPIEKLHCPCVKPCVDVTYSHLLTTDMIDGNNVTRIHISFPDNSVTVVTEHFSYSFSALISDTGGGLGFFLGISVLTIVEIIEEIITFLCSRSSCRKSADMQDSSSRKVCVKALH